MRLAKKYRLPPEEEKRWDRLVYLEALRKIDTKEKIELEKLDRKRHRLLRKDPKIQKYLRHMRNSNRRIRRLRLKLEKLLTTANKRKKVKTMKDT